MKKLVLLVTAGMLVAGCDALKVNLAKKDCDAKGVKMTDVATSGSPDTIQFAVAWSSCSEGAGSAAEKAATAALGAIDGKAKAVAFYTYYQDPDFKPDESSQATACKADLKAEDLVATTVNKVCAGVPNIGCRARCLTNGGTLLKDAVAVLAIGGKQASAAVGKVAIDDDRLATGKGVAAIVKDVKNLKVILALAEMRLSFETKEGVSVEDFIKGALTGAPKGTTLFGGNSMPDDMASAGGLAGKQFINGQALKGHVVTLGIGGPIANFGNHANEFTPSSKTAEVTKTNGKWIVELDGKPAETVYRTMTGMKAEDELTSDFLHPIGVDLGNGKNYTRMILNWVKDGKDKDDKAVDAPDGSLAFVAPVVKGTKVFCLACQKKPEPIVASAKAAVTESVAAAKAASTEPSLLMMSNCCARGMRLRTFRDGNDDEIKEAVLPALGKGVPIFGFYAWGELGRIQGDYQGMNHQYQQHTFVSNMVGITK
ncbi:MAG: FIST C-terminal domain-containing protein [Phycisphaerae bacterium]|jgi:hypothetical protein|nr:FIST C-terminal domain-containing protein [Phycisphaerae bacterium]